MTRNGTSCLQVLAGVVQVQLSKAAFFTLLADLFKALRPFCIYECL